MQWLRQSWIGVLFAVAVLAFAFSDFGEPDEEPTSESSEEGFQNPDGSVAEQPVPPYARTGWSTLHADERNSRFVPTRLGGTFTRSWGGLAGTPVITSPVLGPEGHVYVTTGLGPGKSNLHAYDLSGSLLWKSEPWEPREADADGDLLAPTTTVGSAESEPRSPRARDDEEGDLGGPDSCAILQSPIVDESGDLYLSDCDQLWAFFPDGEVKWVAELPAAPPGSPYQLDRDVPFNPFVTAAFTVDGSVLGVTTAGQVVVVDRTDGVPLITPFLLPSPPVEVAANDPRPDDLWTSVDIDPEIVTPVWEVLTGQRFPSPNTPAIGPDGTIYIAASTDVSVDGGLYAFDFDPDGGNSEPGVAGPPGELTELWETSVGPGVRSTPVVTHDGERVLLTDAVGGVWAVSADQGGPLWNTQGESRSTSVTTGPDGHVYVLGAQGLVDALDSDGVLLWRSDLNEIELEKWPSIDNVDGPIAYVRGQPTLTTDGLVVGVEAEYRVGAGDSAARLPVASTSYLLDPETGEVVRKLADQRGEPSGAVFSSRNGAMIVIHTCVNTGDALANEDVTGFILASAGLEPLELGCGFEVFRSTPPVTVNRSETTDPETSKR